MRNKPTCKIQNKPRRECHECTYLQEVSKDKFYFPSNGEVFALRNVSLRIADQQSRRPAYLSVIQAQACSDAGRSWKNPAKSWKAPPLRLLHRSTFSWGKCYRQSATKGLGLSAWMVWFSCARARVLISGIYPGRIVK